MANCTLSNSNCSRTNRIYKSRFSKEFDFFFLFHLCRPQMCEPIQSKNTREWGATPYRNPEVHGTATSERCKAFFFFFYMCYRDYKQFTDLGTTIIYCFKFCCYLLLLLCSRCEFFFYFSSYYRCRANTKRIFHFQCIACAWFRR